MQKVIGFDTETVLTKEGKFLTHNFYSAQFYCPELKINLYTTDKNEVAKMFRHKTRGAVFLALNAEFDFCVLAKVLKQQPVKMRCLYNKSRFLYGKVIVNGHAHKIYDLMNIFTGWSLKKLGDFLNYPKLDKPEYLGQREPKTLNEKIYFQKYAMRDAEIGYKAGKWILNKFGKITVSAPSLAFWYFNNQYKPSGLYYAAVDPLKSKLMLSYKGGRCEAFKRGQIPEKIFAYDKVSLYPSVMYKYPFPMGFNGFKEKNDVNLCHDGFANVLVSSDTEIPFLCIKRLCEDGNVKLVFPNGKFKGWFTYPELRYFCRMGYGKILKTYEAFEVQKCQYYFKDYIDEFFTLKNNDKEHASFWKLLMNSLYGKFAQDAHSPELQVNANGEIIPFKEIQNKKLNLRTNILVSSYIAAYSRIEMHKEYLKAGVKNLVYTDTDSIHSLKPYSNIGTNLGDLGFVCEGSGTYIRSKFYILNDMVKCRGMEHIFSAENVRKLIAANDVECMGRTLLRLRAAFRRHAPFLTQQETSKHFSLKSDCKRLYAKELIGESLLKEYTESLPLDMEIE